MPKVLVGIDGNSLLHRAYWAIRPMNDSSGRPINAVYGFFRMLFKLVRDYKPQYLTVAFDVHEKTFRHDVYEAYKGGRKQTPADLIEQFELLRQALEMVGVRYVERPGFEADDILGTLAFMSRGPNYIVTGDKDQLQLITNNTTVLLTRRGVTDVAVMNEEALEAMYGLRPNQIPDLKGLMGDPSDNLPGVAGVGEKTALKLLRQYGTVRELYRRIDELPANKLREKLIAGRVDAFMSMDLATIRTDLDLGITLSDLAFDGFDRTGSARLIQKHEFYSFRDELGAGKAVSQSAAPHPVPVTEAEPEAIATVHADVVAAYMSDDALYVSNGQDDFAVRLDRADVARRRRAGRLLSEAVQEREFVGFNVKQMMHELGVGLDAFPNCTDCMLGAWTIDPSSRDYSIKSVMDRAGLPVNARSLFVLRDTQRQRMERDGLLEVYAGIEMPLIPVLYQMERNGVRVREEDLRILGDKYEAQMESLTAQIYDAAGRSFNLGSTKQLGEILFVQLGLPSTKKTKTGFSTDITVLEQLKGKHPIVPLLIEYRAVSKLKQTYVDGLLSCIQDGYIHTTFLQTATSTGRLSSADPNLQNIPIHSQMADDIRRAFIAPDEQVIVSADYSQIELRILADMAGDEQMRAAFERGEDIHARTAAEILGKDIDQVSREERSHAKAVNFGIVYGISDFGLARNTGLTKRDARAYIDRYLQRFPGIQKHMEATKSQALQDGLVRTMYGRIRYVPEISSKNHSLRAAAERAALNMPVQGTAADIMKIAMIRAFEALGRLESRLVLQVHDELIAYAPQSRADEVQEALRISMEGAASLRVPLKVNTAVGKTWLEAK